MQFEEGQIYEGGISISGGDGPFRRWLVVAPFGKTHIHCIDDPLELRCWPLALVTWGIESGRLRYVGYNADHPALEVQRVKERLEVHDAHLSLSEKSLQRLIDALEDALEQGEEYALYLAGEILASASHSALLPSRRARLIGNVHALLASADLAQSLPMPPLHDAAEDNMATWNPGISDTINGVPY